jgi:L-alanine-DL-glutamate epimerase-like enolase superfamily enzyme
MEITHLETSIYRIPLPTPLSDSTHGIIPSFELLAVKLACDDGTEGIGYAYTIKGMRAVKALLDGLLAELLLGQDPFHTQDLWESMWWASRFVGRGGVSVLAMAACDIALWDAKGKATGRSLAELLGGSRKAVLAYAGGVDLLFSLHDLLTEVTRQVEQGNKPSRSKWAGRTHRKT